MRSSDSVRHFQAGRVHPREDPMFDTVQSLALNLPQSEELAVMAFRILGWLVVGVTAATLLTCAGFVLAQCCRGGRRERLPVGLMMLVAFAAGGIAGVFASWKLTPRYRAENRE